MHVQMESKARISSAVMVALAFALAIPGAAKGEKTEKPPIVEFAGRWISATFEEWEFVSDAGELATASLADRLLTFRNVVSTLSNAQLLKPRVPTVVYLFSRDWEFERFTGLGTGVVGFFVSGVRGNFVAMRETSHASGIILLHEYAHFLVRNQGGFRAPLWYSEGFADFVATLTTEEPMALGLPNALRIPQSRKEELLDLERVLNAATYSDFDGREVSRFYQAAWIFVHFLHVRHHSEMMRLLNLFNEGAPIGEAFSEAFGGASVSTLEGELSEYWKRFIKTSRLPALRLEAERYREMADLSIRELPKPRVAARLGELSLSRHMDEVAAMLFGRALESDENELRALTGMARIHSKAGRWDEATQYAERALSLDDALPSVRVTYGDVLLARLEGGESLKANERAAMLRNARSHFASVIKRAPDEPMGFDGYGRSYLFADGDFTLGIQALQRARERLGSDNSVLYHLGALHRKAGNQKQARELLKEVIHWSHAGGDEDDDEDFDFGRRAKKLLMEMDEASAADTGSAPPSTTERGRAISWTTS